MKSVLVFDIWGDYAHFRKFYTTSSPLSFSIPPRTAISGLIGAIIGLQKEDYLRHFSKNQAQIGVRLLAPVKKTRLGINHINTKDNNWTLIRKKGHEPRTQIRTEFLKDPKYRVYVYHKDKSIYNNLHDYLRAHKSVYTPCLGLSELISNFSFVGEYSLKEFNESETLIASAVPVSNLLGHSDSITFEAGKKYYKERIPIEMTPERIVTEYGEVIYEAEGKPIKVKLKRFWELEYGERIVFL